MKTADDYGYDFEILKAVESVNEKQKKLLFEKANEHYNGDLAGKKFAVWGLSFKPNTDDMREAPAVVVCNELLKAGASVVAFDPEAIEECQHRYLGDRIEYASSPMDALKGADGLFLVTEWNEFRRPDFDQVKSSLRVPVIFDGRNIYSRKVLEGMGFTYYGLGT